MDTPLPAVTPESLIPTRNHLQNMALILSALQRAVLPKQPRDWHYGLNVGLRGITTQPFSVGGKEHQASIDLVRHKLRLDGKNWLLASADPEELFGIFQGWLKEQGSTSALERPDFLPTAAYDMAKADDYAKALWWFDKQFQTVKAHLTTGETSPVLLYPHHFDLALAWSPYGDDRQLAIGFSTGDLSVTEPYVYLTAYPAPLTFTQIILPSEVHWQSSGFSGAVLPYAKLRAAADPATLLCRFAINTMATAEPLLR